jgi:hypothetical protein
MESSIEIDKNDEADNEALANMKIKIAGLQRRIQEFEDSTSWRITKPLRTLKRLLTGKR